MPQWNTNLNFYDDILQKYMFYGPKTIPIPVRLDPDLFGQIRMLEKAMGSYQSIGLRVIAKSSGSENTDFWMLYSMDYRFSNRKNCSRTLV
jgi:hypothetical protein